MCCLVYEYDTYMSLKRSLPKIGSVVKTPSGEGKVVRHNAVCQRLTVRLADGSGIETPVDSLQQPTGQA
jgi:cell fate regulator YaaT (PSP1 superfamily)